MQENRIAIFVFLALCINIAFWGISHHVRAKWEGVPPVPSKQNAAVLTLNDSELAYRSGALTLQDLGDSGGEVTPLASYDYNKLGQWFTVLDFLNPVSEHVPALAAYYFGALRDHPQKTAIIVDYLVHVGQRPFGEKWRWLAQAALLAQHRLQDLNRALDIAYTLSRLELADGQQLPSFAREYPAFILKAQGDKEAAREFMEHLLLIETDPNEVRFIQSFLVIQLQVPVKEVELLLEKRQKLK